MSPWLKIVTGLALTGLVTNGYYMFYGQSLVARLGASTLPILAAHNVRDASIRWTDDNGWTTRTARITGTAADPAAVAREIAALPGIHAATMTPR